MPKKKKKEEVVVKVKNGSLQSRGLLFELEHVAVNGREVAFDVLSSILSDEGIDMSPALFSRYCAEGRIRATLPKLLQAAKKTRRGEEKLVEETVQGIRLSLTGGDAPLNGGFKALLDAAEQSGVRIGALSGLDRADAVQLRDRLGLPDAGVKLHCCEDGREFPGADSWLALCRQVGVIPQLCVGVATSAGSCKAALSAGMRCVAVPDAYTLYQDFSGADIVLDALTDEHVRAIMDLIGN